MGKKKYSGKKGPPYTYEWDHFSPTPLTLPRYSASVGEYKDALIELRSLGLGGQKVYVPVRKKREAEEGAVSELQSLGLRGRRIYVPVHDRSREDWLVKQLLLRVEGIYERVGTALITAHSRRSRWAFTRVLGATRLAAELGVKREEIVLARRRAFGRWQYWFERYERPIWQEILDMGGIYSWSRNFYRYIQLRARLSCGNPPSESPPLASPIEPVTLDKLAALAVRSIRSVTWR